MSIDRSRRITFEQTAQAYDEVRPRYPKELIEDVLALSGLPPDGRILEVGCGPGIAYPKAALALKPGGSIALWWIVDQAPDSDLFAEIDRVYRERAPGIENPITSITPEWMIERIVENLATSRCFSPPAIRQYTWDERYTAGQYIKLLSTFSGHQELDPDVRDRLYTGIYEAIERFGGRLIRPCLGVLFHARENK